MGLILYPYFLVALGSKRPWLMSFVTGTVLSLIIEILQSFLADARFGLDRCHHELSRHCARCEHVLFQRRTRYFEEAIPGKASERKL